MQKSIKKIIAGAVAGLMVISSMPFTALAAVGDYEPDVQLQFSTFYDAETAEYASYEGSGKLAASGYTSAGLCNAPMIYDEANGTLKVAKEDMSAVLEYNEEDPVDADWNLGVGDAFLVTIRFDNVSIAASGQLRIRFSDNITPAGYVTTGTGNKTTSYIVTEEEMADLTKPTVQAGFEDPIEEFSASTLYKGMNDTLLGDLSKIKADPAAEDGDGWSDQMMVPSLVCDGDYVDVSECSADNGFFDIVNHTYDAENGYTYPMQFIVASFAFKITGEGPIKFALQDPDGSIDPLLDGAAFFGSKADGELITKNATTYAPNGDNPGSMKMTFMGKNTNRQDTHTHTPGEAVKENEVPATCTTAGSYDSVVYCTECGEEISRTKVTVDPLQHDYTAVVTEPTCTEQGYTTYTCKRGDHEYTDNYTDALGHAYAISSIDWDTLDTATGKVTAAYVCERDASHTKTETVQTTFEVTQQATEDQVELTTYMYSAGEFHSEKTVQTADKLTHTHVPAAAVRENEVPATCSAEGSYDEVVYCTVCNTELSRTNKTIDKIAHTPGEAVRENEVAPTKETAGSYDEVVYCTECKQEISRTKKTIDALGVTITLAKSDIGYVEGLETGANKLAFGAKYTVTAVPVDGAKFVGWEIGGNIVSKEATYTGKAASDITLTPVFEDAASDKITVTFFDKYGNTVKQYKDMTAAQYQEAIAADIDTLVGPNYPSYTFAGWEKTNDEILAIDSSATVWGTYEKVKEEDAKKYTVTTTAELVLPDGVENKQIPYDTKVTVRDTAAKAWRVGEAIVAYGPEYTFYVGSDVTVEAIYETVEEKATTTVVGANLVAGSNYKFNIVATRNIPDGYELDDYGFVYGKNLTDEELNLDKVGETAASGAQIKAVHGGTRNLETNEFAFNYGIKAMNAPVTAKSFVIVSKDGKTEIVYSDMFTQNY